MNCAETKIKIEPFLAGELSGAEARGIRMHLASCSRCASALSASDRIETLTALDEEIEPSPDFQERFHSRLEQHRASQAAATRQSDWWTLFLQWSIPRQLAAAGSLVVFLALGLYLGLVRSPEPAGPGPIISDIAIAENLPLLKDMQIIENLDLLEDFDTIQGLAAGSGASFTVQ